MKHKTIITCAVLLSALACAPRNPSPAPGESAGGNGKGQPTGDLVATNKPPGTVPGISPLKGTETQNGGYGVLLDGRTYSLDLYLRGSHLNPHLSPNVPSRLSKLELELLNEQLKFATPAVRETLIRKFSHLRTMVLQRGLTLKVDWMLANLQRYTWVYLPQLECADIGDDNSPFPKRLLAYRENRWIRVCRDYASLDEGNQAALLFHEIVYASLPRKSYTRELTGLMFNEAITYPTREIEHEFRDVVATLDVEMRQDPKFPPSVSTSYIERPQVARISIDSLQPGEDSPMQQPSGDSFTGLMHVEHVDVEWATFENEPRYYISGYTETRRLVFRTNSIDGINYLPEDATTSVRVESGRVRAVSILMPTLSVTYELAYDDEKQEQTACGDVKCDEQKQDQPKEDRPKQDQPKRDPRDADCSIATC